MYIYILKLRVVILKLDVVHSTIGGVSVRLGINGMECQSKEHRCGSWAELSTRTWEFVAAL